MSTNKSFSIETSERYSRALFEVVKDGNDLENAPQVELAWIKTNDDIKSKLSSRNTIFEMPLYFTTTREQLLMSLPLDVGSKQKVHQLRLAGVALFSADENF